jgi:outer membrane murein-binding lipoprotein Lpp
MYDPTPCSRFLVEWHFCGEDGASASCGYFATLGEAVCEGQYRHPDKPWRVRACDASGKGTVVYRRHVSETSPARSAGEAEHRSELARAGTESVADIATRALERVVSECRALRAEVSRLEHTATVLRGQLKNAEWEVEHADARIENIVRERNAARQLFDDSERIRNRTDDALRDARSEVAGLAGELADALRNLGELQRVHGLTQQALSGESMRLAAASGTLEVTLRTNAEQSRRLTIARAALQAVLDCDGPLDGRDAETQVEEALEVLREPFTKDERDGMLPRVTPVVLSLSRGDVVTSTHLETFCACNAFYDDDACTKVRALKPGESVTLQPLDGASPLTVTRGAA